MRVDREWAFLAGPIAGLAVALFAGLAFVADGIRDRDNVNDTIAVTGSAKQRITSIS